MNEIYIIVFGIMSIFIIFTFIFEVEKRRLKRETLMEKQIKNVYKFLGKKKRYFIMEPYDTRTLYNFSHKCIEVNEDDISSVGLQRVNYRDIMASKTYLKVLQLDDDLNLKTEYFLYNKN